MPDRIAELESIAEECEREAEDCPHHREALWTAANHFRSRAAHLRANARAYFTRSK